MLGQYQIIFVIFSAIILFIYGLEQFSKEIQALSKSHLKGRLESFASNRWRGFLLGATFTAIVQSSSAVSAITVGFVHAGIISFRNSIAILFGCNVGTTLTAQIVALKLTGFGPYFIVIGFLLSLLRTKYRTWGKAIFYFGFIFFSLDLISSSLGPLRQSPQVLELLQKGSAIWLGVFMGAAVTFIVQSSSVSTGLVVLLVQQGTLSLDAAIPIVLGANIGTTGTAIMASLGMDLNARRAAMANTLFNIGGVIVILPFISLLTKNLILFEDNPAQVVANVHLMFNLAASFVFLFLLKPFENIVLRIIK
jgi:phosphate:Na+ symporter